MLSVLFEQILDLLHLAFKGSISNFKKGKWQKIIGITQSVTDQKIINLADANLIGIFKEQFRTAEMHKFSMIRAFTAKEQWNHLHEEEQAVGRILANIYNHYIH